MNAYRHASGELLPLSRIFPVIPSGTSKVRWFADKMQAGEMFPPIRIRAWADAKYIVLDGGYRFAACVLAGVHPCSGSRGGRDMSRLLPSLTEPQQQMVLAALSTLRLSGHDHFLLDLASALARCPNHPVSDLDVKVAVRQLLGVVPLRGFVQEDVA